MMSRITKVHRTVLLWAVLLLSPTLAWAQEEGAGTGSGYAVEVQTATGLGERIVGLIQSVGMPLGGAFLLLAVVIIAVKLALASTGVSGKKEDAMQGLMYVAIGGIILGGALFITGALLGIGQGLEPNGTVGQ